MLYDVLLRTQGLKNDGFAFGSTRGSKSQCFVGIFWSQKIRPADVTAWQTCDRLQQLREEQEMDEIW